MAQYCVNTQAQRGGEHEVHNLVTCNNLPDPSRRKGLGTHPNCRSAVREAKRSYPSADGCKHCSPSCHNV